MSNVLIVGSGARDHAIAWKLRQSPRIENLYIARGNGGTSQVAETVDIDPTDFAGLARFAEKKEMGLTIASQDDLLAFGLVDAFRKRELRIFGPTQAAAKIESSKAFMKRLMQEERIPTAPFRIFTDHKEALKHVHEHGAPIVVKASGLALGKGVYPCRTLAEAESALRKIMVDRVHGEAGNEVVVEDFLDGEELSVHAFCDGDNFVLLPLSRDHKPIHDGNRGENTGGMGTIASVSLVSTDEMEDIGNRFVGPILEALSKRGCPFTGMLYPGLMRTSSGLMLLEVNARFGDPEAQSYVRLLETDLLAILEACVDGTLADLTMEWRPGFAVCVVLASGGYPGKYEIGFPIRGIDKAKQLPGIVVLHAGTSFSHSTLRTSGGRVLSVTGVGDTLHEAQNRVYKAVDCISFEGMQYRTDIGA